MFGQDRSRKTTRTLLVCVVICLAGLPLIGCPPKLTTLYINNQSTFDVEEVWLCQPAFPPWCSNLTPSGLCDGCNAKLGDFANDTYILTVILENGRESSEQVQFFGGSVEIYLENLAPDVVLVSVRYL